MKSLRTPSMLFVFLSLPLIFPGCHRSGSDKAGSTGPTPVITVTGLAVMPRVLDDAIEVTGTVIANEEVVLRSEGSGRIQEIFFREGTPVNRGDLLVKIDDRELQAQLQKLKFEEKQAGDDLFRKKRLFDMHAVSQEEYDNSANQLGIIRSEMDLVQAQLSKTELRAPFSGQIGLRQVSPGEFLSPSTAISVLLQTNPVKIEFSLPEKYHTRVREGSGITFTVTGSDSIFQGTVYAIEPKIDPSSRTVLIRARCSNPGKKLIPGAFARVRLLLQRIPDALVVPAEAIIPQLSGEKVFLCRMGKALLQPVQTGIRTEREVWITGGIAPGDTVLTTGLLQLRDGLPVAVTLP